MLRMIQQELAEWLLILAVLAGIVVGVALYAVLFAVIAPFQILRSLSPTSSALNAPSQPTSQSKQITLTDEPRQDAQRSAFPRESQPSDIRKAA